MARAFKAVAVALSRSLSDKKAEQVALLHVGRTSPVADYMVIATALSRPHLDSLQVEAEKSAKDLGLSLLRRAKPESDHWRVLDFGGLLVHLMTKETRDFYALEKLYHGSPRVSWGPERDGKAAAAPAGRPSSRRPRSRAR